MTDKEQLLKEYKEYKNHLLYRIEVLDRLMEKLK